ncbi:MAG: DUF6416 domain-containing protein [Solirubrobacteraceae bacterium]
MADKTITVDVPEERVAEFYAWFAQFLAADTGTWPPRRGRGGLGPPHGPPRGDRSPWTEADTEPAAWLYGRLSEPARQLFDLLIETPGEPVGGNDLAARLGLDKGAHGLAGILAWPGRWCRKLGREFPITTAARDDGGTDYSMAPETAAVFAAARTAAPAARSHRAGPPGRQGRHGRRG